VVELFTKKQNKDYTTEVELDDVSYKYRLYWNSTFNRWYADFTDLDGNPLVTGVKLTIGEPFEKSAILKGKLFVISSTEDTSPPKLAELGDRVRLYYFPLEEIDDSLPIRKPDE